MSPQVILALTLLGAYLLGCVPAGLLLGKLKGIDIRKTGSGNIGATNLTRALGRRWGITAFILDFAKGLLPALAPAWLALELDSPPLTTLQIQILAGLAAVLGHVFPVTLGFRGGKGVATTFGVMTALLPGASLLAAAIWGLTFWRTRTVSLASVLCAVAFPVGTFLFSRERPPEDFWTLVALSFLVFGLILWRHRENLSRLLKGKENRF